MKIKETEKSVKVLHLELTSCLGCPYVKEVGLYVYCGETDTNLCKNSISEVMDMSRRPIPINCPLESLVCEA